jgi:hypothetical protein
MPDAGKVRIGTHTIEEYNITTKCKDPRYIVVLGGRVRLFGKFLLSYTIAGVSRCVVSSKTEPANSGYSNFGIISGQNLVKMLYHAQHT